jgi:hypothetical protein
MNPMDFAPKFLTDLLPEGVREYAIFILGGGVCLIALLVLLIVISLARFLFGGKPKPANDPKLAEDLTSYPDLKTTSGDRQLRVEGVPARLRLVVVAPAGTASEVDVEKLPAVFEEIVLGLGEIYKHDKPRVRTWPTQVSYQGFGTHFHRNMLTGAKEGEQTRWVMVAGRVKVGKQQLMLGLALQTIKPNTIGRRTIDAHEWATVLRVRVRD